MQQGRVWGGKDHTVCDIVMEIATGLESLERRFSARNHSACSKMLDGIKIEDHFRTGAATLGVMIGEFTDG